MERVICLLAVLVLCACQPESLQKGDLLFHVADEDNAITDVTPGMIDHVAIVLSKDSVIEAVPKGVVTTAIDFLRKQKGYYLWARVEDIDAEKSVGNACRYLGRAYDSLYLPDNSEIYCSELVQLSFVDKRGNMVFKPIPMSFHDASGEITPYWIDFYTNHNMKVPEGKPGTNPGELSRLSNVSIIGKLK
ncbi:MAG: hypothetical protein IJ196_06355 [Prevotella sp.]|nr:hypothetical protein [Prevotella sp.]